MNDRIRLAVFDHCHLRRSAIAKVLHLSGRYRVMAQARLHPGTADRLSGLRVDGALLATGIEPETEHRLIRAAHRHRLPVVAYGVAEAPAPGAVRTGAEALHVCAQVDAPCDADALLLTIDRCFTRGCRVCRHPPRAVSATAAAELSPREQEVFRLLGSGVACKEIAARLALSKKTVYTYAARVRAKLDLGDGAALLQAAIDRTHPPDLVPRHPERASIRQATPPTAPSTFHCGGGAGGVHSSAVKRSGA